MNEKVARLRRLLSEAVPEVKAPTPIDELVLDQSPRARAEREILRLASWYKLDGEIVRFLDQVTALSLSTLSDENCERLLARMKRLEDCLQEGLDPPDCAAAR